MLSICPTRGVYELWVIDVFNLFVLIVVTCLLYDFSLPHDYVSQSVKVGAWQPLELAKNLVKVYSSDDDSQFGVFLFRVVAMATVLTTKFLFEYL